MAGYVVGVLGVGAMGGAMAERLAAAGWPVWVHDIDPSRVAAAVAAGLSAVGNAAELAQRAAVLIVAVGDAAEAEAALLADPTDAADARPAAFPAGHGLAGRVVLLCPTIAPDEVERLAARLAERGVALLEAPMSGGPRRARDGSMSLMVAGDPALRARLGGLLAALSSQVVDLGPRLGDGARMKLVNNLLAATHLAAAAEALLLADRVGLQPEQVLDVVSRSSGQSWIADDRVSRWLGHRRPPHGAFGAGGSRGAGLDVKARMALLAKDTGLAQRMAAAAGVDLRVTGASVEVFARAVADGWAGLDDAHLIDHRAGRPQPAPSEAPGPDHAATATTARRSSPG